MGCLMAAEGFAAVPIWMIRDRRVPRNAILVYASLSSRAGLREIYPSQATIAEESGLSERTVRTMLKELELLGVVSRERRRAEGARRATDGYRLHPSGLPANVAGRADLPANGGLSTGNEQQAIPLIEVDREEVDRLSDSFEPDALDEGTLLPDGWVPTQKHRDLAASFGANFDRELVRFKDHARRVNRRQKNWNTAFTNWLRKGAEMSQQRAASGGQVSSFSGRPSVMDVGRAADEILRARAASATRGELSA